MNSEDKEIVLGIIGRFAARQSFNLSARLYHDLGIGGDDAYELLIAINKRLGTSFNHLNFSDYFPDEGEEGLFQGLTGYTNERMKGLSVAHLLEAVAAGKWFEPVDGNPMSLPEPQTLLGRISHRLLFAFREGFLFFVFPIGAIVRGVVAISQLGGRHGRIEDVPVPDWMLGTGLFALQLGICAVGLFHLRYVRKVSLRFPWIVALLLAVWVAMAFAQSASGNLTAIIATSTTYLVLPLAIYVSQSKRDFRYL